MDMYHIIFTKRTIERRKKISPTRLSVGFEPLSIHDLRCVPGPTHTNVIFDCVRPSDLAMSAEELKRTLAKQVESEYPKSFAKITIDEDYVGHTHE